MILYDFSCPIDGLPIDQEDTPMVQQGFAVPVGKHVHLDVNQTLTCENGHVFALTGGLLLSRSA